MICSITITEQIFYQKATDAKSDIAHKNVLKEAEIPLSWFNWTVFLLEIIKVYILISYEFLTTSFSK